MQSGGNISPLRYSKLYTLWNDKLRSGRNHSLNRLYNLEYIKQIHYLTNLCDYTVADPGKEDEEGQCAARWQIF